MNERTNERSVLTKWNRDGRMRGEMKLMMKKWIFLFVFKSIGGTNNNTLSVLDRTKRFKNLWIICTVVGLLKHCHQEEPYRFKRDVFVSRSKRRIDGVCLLLVLLLVLDYNVNQAHALCCELFFHKMTTFRNWFVCRWIGTDSFRFLLHFTLSTDDSCISNLFKACKMNVWVRVRASPRLSDILRYLCFINTNARLRCDIWFGCYPFAHYL